MNTHDLAKILLNGPNLPIVIPRDETGYDKIVGISTTPIPVYTFSKVSMWDGVYNSRTAYSNPERAGRSEKPIKVLEVVTTGSTPCIRSQYTDWWVDWILE